MKKIFVVNGTAQSGKNTFVNFCIDELKRQGLCGIEISSVDAVKEAALILGWDGIKDEKGRQFLSDLKDVSAKEYDGPMEYMSKIIESTNADFVFVYIREPKEIQKMVKLFSAKTILIERSSPKFNNHADQNVNNYDYDIYIDNTGPIGLLRRSSIEFITLEMADE